MKNSGDKKVSLWKRVQKSWSKKMSRLFFRERKKPLPDELTGRKESLSVELTKTRESLPEELIETGDSLPDVLIEEILSWLPVKSVVRFNIVCKMFYTIIQDPKFIDKHMHHAKIDVTMEKIEYPKAPLIVYSRINGLLLERDRLTRSFQIRNYATNKILQLPELKERVIKRRLSHISHTNEYKVLVVCREGNSGIGMRVLTAGTDVAWRPIEMPISFDRKKNCVKSFAPLEGISYIVEFSVPDLKQSKMLAFKLEDETFMEISMPQEVLFSSESEFWAVKWEMTIALTCRVDDGFLFWVLDNGRRSKWIEKKVVFETDASQDDVHSLLEIAQPICVIDGEFFCSIGNLPIELVYDMESKMFMKVPILPQVIRNKNTLVSFRGMH